MDLFRWRQQSGRVESETQCIVLLQFAKLSNFQQCSRGDFYPQNVSIEECSFNKKKNDQEFSFGKSLARIHLRFEVEIRDQNSANVV